MILLYLTLIDDEGNQDFFEKIYIEYRVKMLYAAKRVLGNHQDSEDAVHETFIKIAKNIKSLQNLSSSEIFSYVIKATKNTAINMLQSKAKSDKLLNIDDFQDIEDTSILEEFCVFENYEAVKRSIEKLTEAYRDVFYLYYVYELTLDEIARKLDRKPSTVRKQITRGREIFIRSLKKELDIDE